MTRRVTITSRARADLIEICSWYSAIRLALSDEFMDEFEDLMQAIGERAESFPEIEPSIRRAICRRFPYKVYFSIRADEARLLAVYHAKRDPRRWNDPK